MNFAAQSAYSNPGTYAALLDDLPSDVAGITDVVRNVLIHYRGGGIEFTGERLEEINHRWIDDLLATDQRRNGTPLATPREPADRVAGCCRDYTLLTVSALRHKGIPARSRIGFAPYFQPGFNCDHVVAEYWNGDRWAMVDTQIEPGEHWGFDVQDMPAGTFKSAAEVWLGYRSGELDGDLFGVDPSLPLKGGWFIRDYVFLQLAHLQCDEILLWDGFGAMADDLAMDLGPTDEVAALLVASDTGDEAATTKLRDLYRNDPDWHPTDRLEVHSPSGTPPYYINTTTRQKHPA